MPDLLTAARVLGPEGLLAPGWVDLDGDRVIGVGHGEPPRPPERALGDVTVAPGFVDVHVHGGGGASFDGGDAEAVATAVAAHRRHGTTSMVASLVTDDLEGLTRSTRSLADLSAEGVLAGVHLEGPWLSTHRAGAHDPVLLSTPDPGAVEALLEAGSGHLRMVTLAPELPGARDAVRRLVERGVTVAVGHTDARYDETRAALDAGATVGTHLFNAMRGLHHRKPGPIAALLEHPDTYVELVADGVHVHPAMLRLAWAHKPDRVVLVTDAMSAAAAADGDYRLGSMRVTVRDGVARLADSGAIAGSTLTSAAAVRFAVQAVGIPLEQALRAATSTPAAMLGLTDVGVLAPGRRADLVVLDGDLAVTGVMAGGRWLGPGNPA